MWGRGGERPSPGAAKIRHASVTRSEGPERARTRAKVGRSYVLHSAGVGSAPQQFSWLHNPAGAPRPCPAQDRSASVDHRRIEL
jgi:hypothetical protein